MHIGRREFLAASGSLLVPVTAKASASDAAAVVGGAAAIVRPQGIAGLVLAGHPRLGAGRALTAADRWHIGSNTKAMTGVLYARLVEQGLCRWDSSVAALFPEARADKAWSAVGIRQLLAHSAGLTDMALDTSWLVARHGDSRPLRVQRSEFARAVLAAPPSGTPGAYAYGNANYIMVGAAIEAVTGREWESVIASELFAPLAMRSAGFGAPPASGPWGHGNGTAGLVAVDPAHIADNPAILGPAGRVHAALADYGRFLSIFLDAGRPILRATTLETLLTPLPGVAYAGGWSVGEDRDAGQILSHEGSNTLWHVIAVVIPARKIAYAVVVNQGGSEGRSAALALLSRVRMAPSG